MQVNLHRITACIYYNFQNNVLRNIKLYHHNGPFVQVTLATAVALLGNLNMYCCTLCDPQNLQGT